MSESELTNIKFRILDLFSQLDNTELNEIERWISSKSYKRDLKNKRALQKTEKKLIEIGNDLRQIIPFEAEWESEPIAYPTVGDQAHLTKDNTCHVDAFLYDDEEVENLVKNGKLKRFYCLDCHSRNVKELTFISHSKSREIVQYIFKVLLPNDLEDKQVLDIGSRLGAVLYGAYYFSNATKIIGIEMSKDCCEVQERIIDKYSMDADRIKIIHSDVMEQHDVIKNSDVLVMNIVDYFVDVEKHKEMWYFFKKHFKKGSYVVMDRSIEDTLSALEIFEEFMNWLSICKPFQLENEVLFDMDDCHELFLYTVN